MKNKIKKFGIYGFVALLVMLSQFNLAYAGPTFASWVNDIVGTVGAAAVRLIFSLAFAYFLWGVLQYVLSSGDETKKKDGKQVMIWGLVGLAVMFSVYAIVRILGNTFFVL